MGRELRTMLTCWARAHGTETRQASELDNDGQIIAEYRANLSPSGEPGIGDRFLKWVLTNLANPERCDLVTITPMKGRGFEEFPDEAGREDFDPADRKFVAAARAHGGGPVILQGLDSKW